MLYANAAAAVPIVANINAATSQTGAMTQFTNSTAQVSIISFTNVDGTSYAYNTAPLSVSESATIYNAIFTIWNNRLTNYNSQLAAVSG